MSVFQSISLLLKKGLDASLIEHQDCLYVHNRVLSLLGLETYEAPQNVSIDKSIPDLLEELTSYAVQTGLIGDLEDEKAILSSKIMDCFVSKPSEINHQFYTYYQESPEAATDYFYQLSKDSNYIQMKHISKNIHYKSPTPYGELDITINLSKPEKDPEQIKKERELKKDLNYPKCLLCVENEGYPGRIGYPSRSNHRLIKVPLEGENWFLQYSPYVYYNEHSIFLAEEHRDMKIDRSTFERLTAFVEKFPHYFIGSNADLPIVGGSILSHDHYQGGRFEFAMTKAKDDFTFQLRGYSEVQAAVVKWPMSVIRLRSRNRTELVDCASFILQAWKSYNDPNADIYAFSGDIPHNTITPIARIRDGLFEIDLVLRNNRTTENYPMGIFHPHQDAHHIKKENIGLIEVMGLAVLPARLKTELEEIKNYLLNEPSEIADYHLPWAQEIKERYITIDQENVSSIVDDELGKKFLRILEDAGVFKMDNQGREAFNRFIYRLKNDKAIDIRLKQA
ncbi:UDP-glucose--hexose-1-phosphate uridylyltransferase [Planococcus shenhongbingii]|uniref:UDP-glucose--hexose-1-phosphate uridylyltransferase n=1 Tax=Planococcus shenhongbingii TaxID=3058398 RepID=UPI00261A385B|nr:UDP-glucose--hexose-1-phosphate uridylyltransferase [Planococcus sp. N016]WKA60334.1 UDP-glucose--hexose-1-phosphate uridylyltransferase [Planococcus sp. N016]